MLQNCINGIAEIFYMTQKNRRKKTTVCLSFFIEYMSIVTVEFVKLTSNKTANVKCLLIKLALFGASHFCIA